MAKRRRKKVSKYLKIKIKTFFIVFFVFALAALMFPLRPKTSELEKRTLTTFPAFTLATFWNGDFFRDVDTWFADTFPFRETLIAGNAKYKELYGIHRVKIYGNAIQTADAIPTSEKTAKQTMLSLMEPELSGLEQTMDQKIAAAKAAAASNGAEGAAKKVNRNVNAAPEQFGDIYVADDTAFALYYFALESAEHYVDMLNTLNKRLTGSNATIYDIVVPTSTSMYLSKDVQEQLNSSDQSEAINYIYRRLDNNIKTVPLYEALSKHTDEYIYFRTDHHWTALGAYYAYEQLAGVKGVTPNKLASYQSVDFPGFLGSFYSSSGQASSLAANPDTVTAYYPAATNDMEFIDMNGETQQWKIIEDVSEWDSSSKYNCFIGGDEPLTTIENPNLTNGSACVVVKESFGNAFVPFLVDHYQTVYVVDYRYYGGSLVDLVNEKGIKDVVFLNNIAAATTDSLIQNMVDLVNY